MCLVNKTIEIVREDYDPIREGVVLSCNDETITICELETERLYDFKWSRITTIRIIE
jgi:hypothetical protein